MSGHNKYFGIINVFLFACLGTSLNINAQSNVVNTSHLPVTL